jgi:hypothetical protein
VSEQALKTMKVWSGSLNWTGKASCVDEAVIRALVDAPECLGVLVRIHDGLRSWYISSEAALKLAGYSIRERKALVSDFHGSP